MNIYLHFFPYFILSIINNDSGTMKAHVAHKTIKIMPLLCNSMRKVLIVERLPKHAFLLNHLSIKGQGICLPYARLDYLRNESYIKSEKQYKIRIHKKKVLIIETKTSKLHKK